MTHLTQRTYELLLHGSLSAEDARSLARHLHQPCAVCEEFLASLPGADAADGRVDAALGAFAPAGGRGNDLEFARIERRLREVAAAPGPAPRRVRVLPAAIAAAVLAAGVAALVVPRSTPRRGAWDGEKGAAVDALGVRLRYAVVRPGATGAPALERGVSGEPVAAAASLQFEIDARGSARVALVRVGADGAPEPFWSDTVGPGRTSVTIGGRPASYPLRGLVGRQRFVVVATAGALDAEQAARAAEAVARPSRVGADPEWLAGLSLDMVEVEVR